MDKATTSQSSYEALEEIPFAIVPGERRSSQVLWSPLEKQLYRKNTISPIGISYLCYEKKCRARVYVKGDKCLKEKSSQPHEHSNNLAKYEKFAVLNKMKSKAIENKKSCLKKLCDDVLAK